MCCWNQSRQGCDLAGEELAYVYVALASPSVCVCMHACMCVCMQRPACACACTFMYSCICIFGHGCGRIHVHVCVCNIVVKEEGLNTHFSVLIYNMQCKADYPAIVHTLVETLELLQVIPQV